MDARFGKYAKFLVETAINLQEGQYLIIEASTDAYLFVRELTKVAFEKKAKDVIVYYDDVYVDLERCKNVDPADIKTVHPWHKQSREYYFEKGACSLGVRSSYPYLFEGVDFDAVSAYQSFANEVRNVTRYYIGRDNIQWCGSCYPNELWATTLFPDVSKEEAMDKMFDAVYDICRIKYDNDPAKDWELHCQTVSKNAKKINEMKLDRIHFKNSLGTDITIGMFEGYTFCGGSDDGNDKKFIANVPTEEIFASPDKFRVDGIVYASKPLALGGSIVEDFYIEFKEGRVTNVFAKKNQDALEALIATDEGSHYLGEVAFVAYDSPISNSGLLFYNTLYDENAACHLALGKGFNSTYSGLSGSDLEAWEKYNLNTSSTHCDFMFGTSDLVVTGYDKEGNVFNIMDKGNFII